MRKIYAFLAVVLFVVGVLIVPAVHNLHLDHSDSSEHSETHDPGTCAACMIAATAVVVTSTHIAAVPVRQPFRFINFSKLFLEDILVPVTHPARAPPCA